jgi:hypothetical protein
VRAGRPRRDADAIRVLAAHAVVVLYAVAQAVKVIYLLSIGFDSPTSKYKSTSLQFSSNRRN